MTKSADIFRNKNFWMKKNIGFRKQSLECVPYELLNYLENVFD